MYLYLQFQKRYWPSIYGSLDKITADYDLKNSERIALNNKNTNSKYGHKPRKIFERNEILKKNSTGGLSFPTIKDKQQVCNKQFTNNLQLFFKN